MTMAKELIVRGFNRKLWGPKEPKEPSDSDQTATVEEVKKCPPGVKCGKKSA